MVGRIIWWAILLTIVILAVITAVVVRLATMWLFVGIPSDISVLLSAISMLPYAYVAMFLFRRD